MLANEFFHPAFDLLIGHARLCEYFFDQERPDLVPHFLRSVPLIAGVGKFDVFTLAEIIAYAGHSYSHATKTGLGSARFACFLLSPRMCGEEWLKCPVTSCFQFSPFSALGQTINRFLSGGDGPLLFFGGKAPGK